MSSRGKSVELCTCEKLCNLYLVHAFGDGHTPLTAYKKIVYYCDQSSIYLGGVGEEGEKLLPSQIFSLDQT